MAEWRSRLEVAVVLPTAALQLLQEERDMARTHQHVGVRTGAGHRTDRRIDRDPFDVEDVEAILGGDDLERCVSKGQARRKGHSSRLIGIEGSSQLDPAGAVGNEPAPATRRPASNI